MHWVVQSDLFQRNERPVLLETLQRIGLSHQVVSVTNSRVDPEVRYDGPIITNGSLMLSNIAIRRGWQPGSLFNNNFSVGVWYPYFKDYLLNRDAAFSTVRTAEPMLDTFFIRPLHDDKSFDGRVMTRAEFKKWQSDIIERNGSIADTDILIASVKPVGQEHRHYIVDGRVITSSRYKLNGKANQSPLIDDEVVRFAEQMAAVWQPARAFVLDTYQTGDEVGIVEMGGICHAGLYQADINKLVGALEDAFG